MSKVNVWTRLTSKVPSHKGRVLFILGSVWVLSGVSQIISASAVRPNATSSQIFEAHLRIPGGLVTGGALFILSGLIAVVASFTCRYYYGFFALMLMSMWWMLLFVGSLIMTGYLRALPSICTWALVSIFLHTLSSWQEAIKPEELLSQTTPLPLGELKRYTDRELP